jgi:sarcosine oxidase subunit gamma
MPDTSVALTTSLPLTRFVFRGRPAAIAAAEKAFGVALPDKACTAAVAGERSALWLGPDEWLLLAPAGQRDSIDASFGDTLGELPHSLVDVGERQIAFILSGPQATVLLNAACPLDFDTIPVGFCSRTILGKAEIVLWRTGVDVFHIEVWRSFASYVSLLLTEAGREFGLKA